MKAKSRRTTRRARARARVVGVIPSRWGSTRFPGKSLAPICGKPLVQWVYERAKRARVLDELVVATDDERIAAAVARFGGRAVMTRSDHPSGTDRVAEAVKRIPADIVINIQGDEPLVDPRAIDGIGRALVADEAWDMATPAAPMGPGDDVNDPSIVKVVCDKSGRALYFSRSVIPFVRKKGAGGLPGEPLYWRHIGLYAFRRGFLERVVRVPPCAMEEAEKLEQLRALYIGARIRIVRADSVGPAVDTPGDVARAEAALRAAGLA